MIEQLKEYIFSIICVCLLCGMAAILIGKDEPAGKVFKLLSALFITLTVLSPWINVRLSDFQTYLDSVDDGADSAVSAGIEYANQQKTEIIKRNAQAYVLEKAKNLGAEIRIDIQVDMETGRDLSRIEIEGNVSPYVRSILSETISLDLGIPEEAQRWK